MAAGADGTAAAIGTVIPTIDSMVRAAQVDYMADRSAAADFMAEPSTEAAVSMAVEAFTVALLVALLVEAAFTAEAAADRSRRSAARPGRISDRAGCLSDEVTSKVFMRLHAGEGASDVPGPRKQIDGLR